MILFYNYYINKNTVRQAEIDFALKNNLNNASITKVYLLCETLPGFLLPDKVITIHCQDRLKFKDVIRFANSIQDDQIKIFCNSDIYFDDTLNRIDIEKMSSVVYCLTRWDYKENGEHLFYENFKSQDAWIFQDKLPEHIGDYYFGLPGCDNHFAHELLDNNLEIVNPSLSVKAIHVHSSNERNYHKLMDRVEGKYAYPVPTSLIGFETDWSREMNSKLKRKFRYRVWKNNLEGTSFNYIQRLYSRILLYIKP